MTWLCASCNNFLFLQVLPAPKFGCMIVEHSLVEIDEDCAEYKKGE
jgi:hypothetical protein